MDKTLSIEQVNFFLLSYRVGTKTYSIEIIVCTHSYVKRYKIFVLFFENVLIGDTYHFGLNR